MTKASVEIATAIPVSYISYSVEITTLCQKINFTLLTFRSDFQPQCNCDEENLGEQ